MKRSSLYYHRPHHFRFTVSRHFRQLIKSGALEDVWRSFEVQGLKNLGRDAVTQCEVALGSDVLLTLSSQIPN